MDSFIERLKALPVLGGLVTWADSYPRLAAWAVLAVGMVVILLFEARDVGLEFGQWLALVIATVLVAGACIWIVSWEDPDEAEAEAEDESEEDVQAEPEPAVADEADETPA